MTTSPGLRRYFLCVLALFLTAWNPLTGSPVDSTPEPLTGKEYWTPEIGERLQIQFSGDFEFIDDVDIYDLDLFDTSVETIKDIHARGKFAICYINAGAWEDWRPDAEQYPASVIGDDYEGWPGEKWLDIRQIDKLAPLIQARFDLCQSKRFDGIEPDNLDGFQNETGFSLSAEDQLTFNRWLAELAHARGLSIGLKNDPDQINNLVDDFDFAILEDCFPEGWCSSASSFIERDKPVFAVEYTDLTRKITPYCSEAKELGFSILLKNRELDVFRETCH